MAQRKEEEEQKEGNLKGVRSNELGAASICTRAGTMERTRQSAYNGEQRGPVGAVLVGRHVVALNVARAAMDNDPRRDARPHRVHPAQRTRTHTVRDWESGRGRPVARA